MFTVVISTHQPTLSSTIRVPELDTIGAAMYAKLYGPSAGIPNDIYKCWTSTDNNGQVTYSLQLTNADYLAGSADQNQTGKGGTLCYTNLTFKNLGIDTVLPFAFSLMEFHQNFDSNHINGFCREHDKAYVGEAGNPHLLRGEFVQEDNSVLVRQNVVSALPDDAALSNLSVAPISFLVGDPDSAGGDGYVVPADDKHGAQYLADLQLDLPTLQQNTQTMFQKVMIYYMSDEDRQNWTGQVKPKLGNGPDELPLELGENNLDQGTQNWLTNT